eukprot:m.260196 g.260196  ORF g.260196 m.260196 type:complete len:263 (-) comp39410_c0_seq1:39-827(-)
MGPEAVSLMIAGAGTWEKPETWSIYNYAIFAIVITIGWEIMQMIVMKLPEIFSAKQIPIRGKHLDVLEGIDVACIAFNRLLSFLFVFNVLQFIFGSGAETGHIIWSMDQASFLNVGGSLVAMFLFYDFFYCLFHMALHHRSVYALVHKHHHRQKAPSRGNADAINVHPFEFAVGEYLHLFTVAIIPCHVIAVFLFIAIGGLAASLNHCRHEVKLPLKIFNTKFHDQHHVVPNTNYSQYISFWDMVWGSFRDHPDDVRPLKQE